MSERREIDPEGQATQTEADTDNAADHDRAENQVDRQADTLRRRGAVARPQAENPAAVEPRDMPAE